MSQTSDLPIDLLPSSPPSKTILSPDDWWNNLNYWWDNGGRGQGKIPDKVRANDCYPAGLSSPSIKEFVLQYQSKVNKEELEKTKQEKNVDFLLNVMNEAWFNGPGQCGEAWNVLCDLCSECWVFSEEEVEDYKKDNEEGAF